MGFYADFWKNFVNFSGKTGVKDFWLTVLVNFIISSVLGVIFPAIAGLFGLVCLIPCIAMCIRRLRDGGFNPLLILLVLIPVLGWLALLCWFCTACRASNRSAS